MVKRLLYIGDAGSKTGFATVSQGLLRGLSATGKYDILQLGINYNDTMPWDEPWRIVPAGFGRLTEKGIETDDPHGTIKAQIFVKRFDPDIVFLNNDYPIAQLFMSDTKTKGPSVFAKHRSIKVLYAPVDSEPAPAKYAEIALEYDLNIAYTYWQRKLMSDHSDIFSVMPVLYHGYDETTYYPMDKALAREQLIQIISKYNKEGPSPEVIDKIKNGFIVYFVGTNQFRKDLPCLFRAFALLQDEVPNAYLIPHTNAVPHGNNGWYLPNLQKLTEVTDAMIMGQSNVFTDEEMRVFYNSADVLAYPTRGEGFGLPSIEAMACKVPVVATNFGPQQELHADGRGYFIDIRDVIPGDFAAWSYFALPDHRSLYKQLKFIYDNPEHAQETAAKAYDWVKQYTWNNQSSLLDNILSKLPEKGDRDEESTI